MRLLETNGGEVVLSPSGQVARWTGGGGKAEPPFSNARGKQLTCQDQIRRCLSCLKRLPSKSSSTFARPDCDAAAAGARNWWTDNTAWAPPTPPRADMWEDWALSVA